MLWVGGFPCRYKATRPSLVPLDGASVNMSINGWRAVVSWCRFLPLIENEKLRRVPRVGFRIKSRRK